MSDEKKKEPYKIRLNDALGGYPSGAVVEVPGPGITEEDGTHFLATKKAERISPLASVALTPLPEAAPAETPSTPPAATPETATAPAGEVR